MSEYKRESFSERGKGTTPIFFLLFVFVRFVTNQHSPWWVIDGLTLCYISLSFSMSQGSIVSAIGNGIIAIISAIAGVIETIIGAIVMVRVVFI
jgi:hypothetical protein